MKRFTFKLEAILTLRKRVQQAAVEAYAQALVEEHKQQTCVSQTDKKLEQLKESARHELKTNPHMESVLSINHASALELDRRQAQVQALEEAQRHTREQMKVLIEAKQETERLVRHREHQKQIHQREQDKWEQKLMDDMINQRFRLVRSVSM